MIAPNNPTGNCSATALFGRVQAPLIAFRRNNEYTIVTMQDFRPIRFLGQTRGVVMTESYNHLVMRNSHQKAKSNFASGQKQWLRLEGLAKGRKFNSLQGVVWSVEAKHDIKNEPSTSSLLEYKFPWPRYTGKFLIAKGESSGLLTQHRRDPPLQVMTSSF